MKKILALFLIPVCSYVWAQTATTPAPKFEGLAMTPPMGWNSWNTFETHIDEQLIRETADLLVSSGMRDAGYTYLVLDDGWMAMQRNTSGDLVADPEKFPSGIEALIDYVHSKGLKFGLYNCAGTKTCAGYPGTRGHEYQDARYYARLNIDYLKYDWCNTEGITAKEAYTTMSNALKTAGHPIVFSLCEWGDNQPWLWAQPVGNLWRISGDISPCFDCEDSHGTWSSWGFMKIVEMREGIRKYSGPDHWNDFDMMEVGNGMTKAEDRSHFAMWCMMASPLMAGNDLRKMAAETTALLTNTEMISVNQDKAGIQGFKVSDENGIETWAKALTDGWAIAFLNRNATASKLSFRWADHSFNDPDFSHSINLQKTRFPVRDLLDHVSAGTTAATYNKTLAPHDIVVLKILIK